jgi:beta-phosphoglucomutase-like phosphatase (HAD superfamily)
MLGDKMEPIPLLTWHIRCRSPALLRLHAFQQPYTMSSTADTHTCAVILLLLCAGVPVAVCSTSNERAVSTIVRVMLGEKVASTMRVFAGDVVPKKKPDPAIYLLAAKELGVNPARYGSL